MGDNSIQYLFLVSYEDFPHGMLLGELGGGRRFSPFFPRGFPNVYMVMPADYDYHSNEIGDYIKTVSSVSKSNCKHSGYNTKL